MVALIDHFVVARFKVWLGGVSHPKGLGYIIIPDDAAASPAELEIPVPPSDIIEELRLDLRHHTRRIDSVAHRVERGIQRMDHKNHRIAERQDVMHMYNVSFNIVLGKMFAKMNPSTAPI